MTKKSKYTALVIKIEHVTISNDTCQPVTISSEEKLMDAIYGNKYSLVELQTPLQTIAGNNLKEIEDKAWNVGMKHNTSDIQIYMIKK